MKERRFKNEQWRVVVNSEGKINSHDDAQLSVLMDIRDELQAVRIALLPLRHLDCSNFIAIPLKLERIARNTSKPRRRKAK